MVGRFISLFYSVLTVFLLFFLAQKLFRNVQTAFIACILLALTGLNVTYAHLAVVDSGVVFWIYATMYFSLLALDQKNFGRGLILAIISCGIALAFKLSFIAIIPLLYVLARKKYSWWAYFLMLPALFLVFELASGCRYTLNDFNLTLHNVATDNMRSREYNKLLNPVCYLFIIVPLMGLPVFFLTLYGGFKAVAEKMRSIYAPRKDIFFIFLLPLTIHLISICSLTFIAARHLLLFTPLFAMLGAAGLQNIRQRFGVVGQKRFIYLVSALILYQLVFVCST
jgi:4-amino-4-deoxy-L-arabinose transferase-like glycosyltransferase